MTNNQIDKLQNFGGRLCDAANYRNKVAHGSAILSMGETTKDKNRTYAIKTAEEYKAYIIELLEILSEK